MALKTHTQMNTDIDALFIVNTDGDIEADDHNTLLSNFTDSVLNVQRVTTVITTTVTVDRDHSVLLCDATTAADVITVTLPAASGCANWVKTVKKIDSGADEVVIDANSTETIDGSETVTLSAQYDYATIICDGTAWWIVAALITP